MIKQFQPSGNLNDTQLQRAQSLFEREAEVLEQLGRAHPQIPDLFAFFELTVPNSQTQKDDKFFYLVQEYIDGQTLEETLQQKGKFSEAEVLEVLKQTLKILEFVHENGSIHRDIKPSNIILHPNGRLYLLDFGAVKYVTKVVANTQSSTGIYSPGFAPPEQMSGGQIFPSSDLYALAITSVMLLTGKHPHDLFDTYNNAWTWKNHAQVSPLLTNLLDRMLLPAPSDRFQSATEVLAVLNPPPVPAPVSVPASPPVSPSTPSLWQRLTLPHFSTVELLVRALFTGFEGGLMTIAMVSLLGTAWYSAAFWLVLVGILIVAQAFRFIEKIDFLILAGISFALVAFLNPLNWILTRWYPDHPVFLSVLFWSIFAGLSTLAFMIVFRLVYKLVSKIL